MENKERIEQLKQELEDWIQMQNGVIPSEDIEIFEKQVEDQRWLIKQAENVEKNAEIIDINARTLWSVSLGGNQRQIELFERIKDVNVGDLVVETSSAFMYPAINRVGYLKEIFKGEDGWTHYIIERLNGKTMDWSNCKFIKVLSDFEHFVI